MKYIEKLHYITHDLPGISHIEQVQWACEAGAKWIQYRCLSKADDELLKEVNAIAEICDDWGTTLIVTNHTQLHGKADIQGFHMEDRNADFVSLRKQLGDDVTLGGSATDFAGIIQLANAGADYIGLGPFGVTTSKINDYAVLGVEGYQMIMSQLKKSGINIAVLAVGGIKLGNVEDLMHTGIYGVAVSGAIYSADDFIEAYQDFYDAVKR